MTVLPIVTGSNNPLLRNKTERITKVTKEILKLIKNMKDTLKDEAGLGLAANQVGEPFRLCLAKFNDKTNVMINPDITWKSEETDNSDEGCLSLPGLTVKITRPIEITVVYLNEKGEEQERKLSGMDARIIQHEVDHLDNILICDYGEDDGKSAIEL
ncbi:peptide deformylase [Patescibacteria group bacterium]|nr:peptide deformylase [Patescibacteria group bacterium]MBU1123040.1 peptide deformylase [Patescibacteria group bacterium]MBU1911068.1 peptide deformylase [Patescibacteria group bacterium]